MTYSGIMIETFGSWRVVIVASLASSLFVVAAYCAYSIAIRLIQSDDPNNDEF